MWRFPSTTFDTFGGIVAARLDVCGDVRARGEAGDCVIAMAGVGRDHIADGRNDAVAIRSTAESEVRGLGCFWLM